MNGMSQYKEIIEKYRPNNQTTEAENFFLQRNVFLRMELLNREVCARLDEAFYVPQHRMTPRDPGV